MLIFIDFLFSRTCLIRGGLKFWLKLPIYTHMRNEMIIKFLVLGISLIYAALLMIYYSAWKFGWLLMLIFIDFLLSHTHLVELRFWILLPIYKYRRNDMFVYLLLAITLIYIAFLIYDINLNDRSVSRKGINEDVPEDRNSVKPFQHWGT